MVSNIFRNVDVDSAVHSSDTAHMPRFSIPSIQLQSRCAADTSIMALDTSSLRKAVLLSQESMQLRDGYHVAPASHPLLMQMLM